MILSRGWSLGATFFVTVFAVFGHGAASAAALDAPQSTVHHPKPASKLRETHRATAHRTATHSTSRVTAGATRGTASAQLRRVSVTRRHRYYERFTASSFVAGGVGASDVTAGEDPVVRQAAIDALGDMNGTAVVIDPSNGRILAMVNQKLALSPGAEPCSTIKLTVALAALSEGIVTRDTPVQLAGFRMDMTQALAKSNNLYFEELGRELGFDRVRYSAACWK
jgi:penicillin-binding protein 2